MGGLTVSIDLLKKPLVIFLTEFFADPWYNFAC